MNNTTDRSLTIERVFEHPRELVFEAWTDAEVLAQWYAPDGCTLHIRRLDVRPGGGFHMCVRNAAFTCWTIGTYLEVVRPERLVFTSAIADAEGNPASPISQGHDPAWPAETTITITFVEQHGRTVVRLEQTVDERLARKTGAYPSWLEMLERLSQQLAGSPQ